MQSGVIRSWPFHIVLRWEFRVWFVVSFDIILKHSEHGSVMDDSNIKNKKYSESEPELMESIKNTLWIKLLTFKKLHSWLISGSSSQLESQKSFVAY